MRLRRLHDLEGREVIINIDALLWLKAGPSGTTLAFPLGCFLVRETPDDIKKLIPNDW